MAMTKTGNFIMRGIKASAKGLANVSNMVGQGIINHPKGALTLTGGALYAANTVPDKVRRNMAHADFTQNATYVKPLSKKVRLVNNSDAAKENVALFNRLY